MLNIIEHQKNKILEKLDIKNEELDEFKTIDLYNPSNELSGFICKRSDHRYGCLIITKVNDWNCLQIIYSTPKLHYPFDLNGNYHWPDCKQIEFYEKLDGTNIVSYHYLYKNNLFLTYKTRLTPVVKDGKFASFKTMWDEYYRENSWIKEVIKLNKDFNLSFEMFGFRNPITIKYSFPLEVNLLFGIRKTDAVIKPISELNLKDIDKIKTPTFYVMFKDEVSEINLTDKYNNFREQMSEKNKNELLTEGMVMYAHVGEPSWKMFKCKPEEIEKIHWTASGSIPKNSLFTTALNVFEGKDEPNINDFIELLKEEYPENLITKNLLKIEYIWKSSLEHIQFTKDVNKVWSLAKESGLDITKDKNETMRFISKYFDKNIMKKVGTIVLKQAGLLK